MIALLLCRLIMPLALALLPASWPASAYAAAPKQALGPAPIAPRADGVDVCSETPPPSTYDRLGEMPGVSETLKNSSRGLLSQLLRTVVALVGVLALLITCGKIIAPRLLRGMSGMGRRHKGATAGLTITERLVLDGRNTLVQVQLAHGPRYLIACGDHGITLVDRLPAPGDASMASAKSFADHLGTRPTSKE